MTLQTSTLSLAMCVLLLGGLAACGGDGIATEPTPTPSRSSTVTPSPAHPESGAPTASATPEGVVIDATIRGNALKPNGERLKAEVGEPITINIDSDRAGELHVHSTPEQELEYGAGKTTLHLVIETPGIVEVEDHTAGKVLVSLEVS